MSLKELCQRHQVHYLLLLGDGEGLQGDSEGDHEGASEGCLQGMEKGAQGSGEEGSGYQGELAGGLLGPVKEGNLVAELLVELDDGRSNVVSAREPMTGEGLVRGAVHVVGGVQVNGGQGHGEGVQVTGERVQGDGEGLQGDSEGDLQGMEKGAQGSGEGEGSGDQGELAGGLHGPVEEVILVAVDIVGLLGPDQEQDLRGLGKFGCQSCEMSFRDTGNLRRHVKLVHTARVVPVKCPRYWCNAEFYILAEMTSHKENCLKVCPYPDCLKQFSKQKHFEAHQRAHLILARRMSD